MNPPTEETNDVSIDNDIWLLSNRNPVTDTALISGEAAERIIAHLRRLDPGQVAERETWADVLPGDLLRLGHDDRACRVVRVTEQDDEYLAITTDCGSGEHVAIVPRTGAVR